MTTDSTWAAMTERERDAVVAEALWPEADQALSQRLRATGNSLLASTWPGMGLVVGRMRELGWCLTIYSPRDGSGWLAAWYNESAPRSDDAPTPCAHGEADSAPSAAALAAVRAMEGEE